jgi:hypothetical protein
MVIVGGNIKYTHRVNGQQVTEVIPVKRRVLSRRVSVVEEEIASDGSVIPLDFRGRQLNWALAEDGRVFRTAWSGRYRLVYPHETPPKVLFL